MKKVLALLILGTSLSFSQGITTGVTINLSGSLPQDTLNALIHVKDTLATPQGSGYYITPTMLLTKVNLSDSSTTNGVAKWFTTTMTNAALALKAPIASPTFTGTVGLPATNLTGTVTPTDSSTGVLIKDSAGKKWLLRVNTEGIVSADSLGQN